jgi:hypothetical protein
MCGLRVQPASQRSFQKQKMKPVAKDETRCVRDALSHLGARSLLAANLFHVVPCCFREVPPQHKAIDAA